MGLLCLALPRDPCRSDRGSDSRPRLRPVGRIFDANAARGHHVGGSDGAATLSRTIRPSQTLSTTLLALLAWNAAATPSVGFCPSFAVVAIIVSRVREEQRCNRAGDSVVIYNGF